MERHQLFDFIAFGEDDFDRDAVALPDGFHHAIGFVGQTTGIQCEDADCAAMRDARSRITMPSF